MDINKLEALSTFLKKASTPIVKNSKKTFLGIARQSHYENVISNIYAFFLEPSEVYGFGYLFRDSLLELIDPKGEKIDIDRFTDFSVDTTDKGGRIVLLLSNDTHLLIVENKIKVKYSPNNETIELTKHWK